MQFISLTVAWTHACIGLYFWLRLKSFFDWAAPMLLSIAVLMPPLAMIGAHHGGREVAELAEDPEWRNENLKRVPAAQARLITEISLVYFPVAYGAAIRLVFAGRGLRTFRERRRGMVTISYPNRQVRVPKGMSVLEASLRHKIPHASVCGGRARCSTCRIRVVSDRSKLPQPTRPRGIRAGEHRRFRKSLDPCSLASSVRSRTCPSFRFCQPSYECRNCCAKAAA